MLACHIRRYVFVFFWLQVHSFGHCLVLSWSMKCALTSSSGLLSSC